MSAHRRTAVARSRLLQDRDDLDLTLASPNRAPETRRSYRRVASTLGFELPRVSGFNGALKIWGSGRPLARMWDVHFVAIHLDTLMMSGPYNRIVSTTGLGARIALQQL